jgi:hypothetical protein
VAGVPISFLVLAPQALDVLPSFASIRCLMAEAGSKTADPSVCGAADKLNSNRYAPTAAGIRWFSYHLQSTPRYCLSPSFRAYPPPSTCIFDPTTSVRRYQANALDWHHHSIRLTHCHPLAALDLPH